METSAMTSRYAACRARLQCAVGWAALGWAFAFSAPAAQPTDSAKTSVGTPPARTVLVMGDSLSAAYGLTSQQGWVALTAARIAETRPGWRVVNASISGETTAGGAARIVGALKQHRPEVVVIALGANDGLRGLPTQQARINLARMIGAAHGAGADVLLIGMRMPPNLGADYTRAFEQNYRDLAERYDTALVPFLLAPIALDRGAYQADNLHPVAAVQPKLRDHVWSALAPLLE
jgi:acyl-CoA thioesterase I